MSDIAADPTFPAGTPGAAARGRGLARALGPVLGCVFLAGLALGAAWGPGWLAGTPGALALLAAAGGLAWSWTRAVRILGRHEQGARGEESVARRLDRMGDGVLAFHGVPLAGGDADHVVVTDRAVWLVETVSWPGRVEAAEGDLRHDGRVYPGYRLEEIAGRAARLAEVLGLSAGSVRAAVCVAEGRLTRPAGTVDGVAIAEIQDLPGVLSAPGEGSFSEAERLRAVRELRTLCEPKETR